MDLNITPKEQKIIDELLKGLDFESIQGYMSFKKWSYWDTECPPSKEDLKLAASENILSILRNQNVKSCLSGGFEAEYFEDDGVGTLTIQFVAQSNSTYWQKEK